MTDIERLEVIATEIIETFEIYAPPIPIETMLNRPRANMWEEVDPTQLSGTFLSLKERYSPRMSLARMLARHIAMSEWGHERGLFEILQYPDNLNAFSRMLIMPRDMVLGLTTSVLNPIAMSSHFEVPKEDAAQRLKELL